MNIPKNNVQSKSSRTWTKLGIALALAVGLVSVMVFFVFAASTPIITTVAGGRSGSWVQVRIDNLPANVDYVVYEGKSGTQGIGGTRVAGFNSGSGGTQYYRFELATDLMSEQTSELRIVGSDGSSAWQTIGFVVTNVPNGTRAAGNVPVTGATATPLSNSAAGAATATPLATSAAGGAASATPLATSAAGAVGTATPLATSAAGGAASATPLATLAAGTATPLATSAAGAVGTATPLATSAAGAVGTATPLATSAAGAVGTANPLATSAAGAVGTATPLATSAAGAVGTATPLATSAAGAGTTTATVAATTAADTSTPAATSAVGTATPAATSAAGTATATPLVSGTPVATATVAPTTAAGGATTATPVASNNGANNSTANNAVVPVTGPNAITNLTFSNQIMMTRNDFGGVASFLISNLPLNTDYTVRIGPAGQNGLNGYVVAHFYTGGQTTNIATFEIPTLLRNETQLDLRLEGQNQTLVKTFPNTNFPVATNKTVQSK